MAGDKETQASQIVQEEEEEPRRSKKKRGASGSMRDPSVPRSWVSLEPRLAKIELAIGEMSDDIGHLSNSVEGLETRVHTACQDTQDLREETLGLVNSALATVREEIAKMREELPRQLTDTRTKVESVKEDVILCKKAAVTGGVTIQARPKVEVPQPEKESRRDKGRRVEEGDQDDEEASHPKAKHADHGKDKAKSKWESKGDDREGGKHSNPFKCFLCEGPHLARNCPVRQKLNSMIATEEESAPTMRMGVMVMNEDAQFANMRLLNTSRVEDNEPNGRASSTSSNTGIKQGGSLMIVKGEEANALGVKFTRVDGEMKAMNSRATPVYERAWNVPVCLGKWKGKVDFLVVDIDDEDVVLGMEFLHKVQPFRVSDGMITITSKGSEIGIKLAQLKERDVRVSSLKAWWASRHSRQGAVLGRTKATPMLGTRYHGGTMGLKCGLN
uniref:Uncharacterized protein n=1 Tax=Chenopodium quinoa TaxID=63459 RepID=A0A803MIM2_CHEQI